MEGRVEPGVKVVQANLSSELGLKTSQGMRPFACWLSHTKSHDLQVREAHENGLLRSFNSAIYLIFIGSVHVSQRSAQRARRERTSSVLLTRPMRGKMRLMVW